jgi:hypothetical protein
VRLLYLKIGKGSYPSKPAQQINELKLPGHPFKKDDRQLVADLLSLCCGNDESPVATIDATCRPKLPSKINANKTMCNNFNIRKLNKAALALHLVGEMKTPEKIPVMRKLLADSNSARIHSITTKPRNTYMFRNAQIPQLRQWPFEKITLSSKLWRQLVMGGDHRKGSMLVHFGWGKGFLKHIVMNLCR